MDWFLFDNDLCHERVKDEVKQPYDTFLQQLIT